jgi:hypothetical protein
MADLAVARSPHHDPVVRESIMTSRWKFVWTRWTCVAAVVIMVGCSTVAPPTGELEASGSATRETSRQLVATFHHVDPCRYTDVRVGVGDAMAKYAAGQPQVWSFATVNVYDVDRCSDMWETRVSGWGVVDLPSGAFTMTGNLDKARLRATVDVYDTVHDRTVAVDVDLTWTGVGDAWRFRDGAIDDGGEVKFRYRSNGMVRDAVVSGTVDLGGFGVETPMPGSGWMGQYSHSTTTVSPKRLVPPSIAYFYAYPDEVYSSGVTALQWWVGGSDPIVLSIDQGIGDVTGLGYVEVAPTETTTYTLTASNRRGSDTAQFTVHVLPPLARDAYEDNDVPARATPIGTDIYGNLSFFDWDMTITPGDIDWFTFVLTGSAIVETGAWGHGDANLLKGLFHGDGTAVAHYESWRETLLDEGTYLLAITAYPDYAFLGSHTRSTGYTLHVRSFGVPLDDVYEPNEEADQATPIELPFDSEVLTMTPGDVDWFTFDLDGPARITATLTHSNFSPDITLYDSDLNAVGGYSTYLDSTVEAGRYYVALRAYNEGTGHYTLSLSLERLPGPDPFEPNNGPYDAATITIPFGANLTITPYDVDWFRFTLATGQTLVASVGTSMYEEEFDARVALFDDAFVQLSYSDDLDPHIEFSLGAGTYFLAVSGWPDDYFMGYHPWEYVRYSLEVSFTP